MTPLVISVRLPAPVRRGKLLHRLADFRLNAIVFGLIAADARKKGLAGFFQFLALLLGGGLDRFLRGFWPASAEPSSAPRPEPPPFWVKAGALLLNGLKLLLHLLHAGLLLPAVVASWLLLALLFADSLCQASGIRIVILRPFGRHSAVPAVSAKVAVMK